MDLQGYGLYTDICYWLAYSKFTYWAQ